MCNVGNRTRFDSLSTYHRYGTCQVNKAKKSQLKTVIKRFDATVVEGDKAAAQEAYVKAVKAVDQAASDNIIHKNNAARKKSRLTKTLNAIQ